MQCRNLATAPNRLTLPWPRKSNEHDHSAKSAGGQQRRVNGWRTQGYRRGCQPRQQQVKQEYLGYDLSDGKPVVGRSLIKVRAMRVPEPLAGGDASEQSDGGVGKIVQRQQQGGDKMLPRCQFDQAPPDQQTYRQA